MPKSSAEPTNLVLEQLRVMRAEATEMRAETNARFDKLEAKMDREIGDLKTAVRALGRQTIAEVYKANKTFAGFSDFEARLEAFERKVF
jgi:hypothetical protein